jgi:hypothetical protein
MVTLRGDVGERSTNALKTFQQSPLDPLETFQKDMGTFFDGFCETLENSGRQILKAIDLHFDVLNSLEIKIRDVSGPFKRREDVAGQKVIESMQKPTVPPRKFFQPVPDTPITYESIYETFPPGSPIRLNVMESTLAFSGDDAADLVFTLSQGEHQSLPYEDVEDYFDTMGFSACDPFAPEITEAPHKKKQPKSKSETETASGDTEEKDKKKKTGIKSKTKKRRPSQSSLGQSVGLGTGGQSEGPSDGSSQAEAPSPRAESD